MTAKRLVSSMTAVLLSLLLGCGASEDLEYQTPDSGTKGANPETPTPDTSDPQPSPEPAPDAGTPSTEPPESLEDCDVACNALNACGLPRTIGIAVEQCVVSCEEVGHVLKADCDIYEDCVGTDACAIFPSDNGGPMAQNGCPEYDAPPLMDGCVLQPEARCPERDFSGADLRCLNLSRANLNRANFSGADLRGAYLWNTGANAALFVGADLRGATLIGDFDDADFTNADLRGANMIESSFSHAIFTGANTDSVIWGDTTCPDGTRADYGYNGGTCEGHLEP